MKTTVVVLDYVSLHMIALFLDHALIYNDLEGDGSEEFYFTQTYSVSVLLVYRFTYPGAFKLIWALQHLVCLVLLSIKWILCHRNKTGHCCWCSGFRYRWVKQWFKIAWLRIINDLTWSGKLLWTIRKSKITKSTNVTSDLPTKLCIFIDKKRMCPCVLTLVKIFSSKWSKRHFLPYIYGH